MHNEDNVSSSANEIDILSLIVDNSRAVATDKELRSLKPGSAEYAAKVMEKFGDKDSSASATEKESTKDIEKNKSINDKKLDGEINQDNLKVTPGEQKRINKLVAEREQVKRDLQFERDERHKVEQRLKDLESRNNVSKDDKISAAGNKAKDLISYNTPKPDSKTFQGTQAEYIEAYAEWLSDKKDFEREQRLIKDSQEKEFDSTIKGFKDRGIELEKKLGLNEGDFDEFMNADDFKIHAFAQAEILKLPLGAAIAYEIASTPELKERFSKASSSEQLRIIGKLESKLEDEESNQSVSNNLSKNQLSNNARNSGNNVDKKVIIKGSPTIRGGTGGSGNDFSSIMSLPKEERSVAFKAARDAERMRKGLRH